MALNMQLGILCFLGIAVTIGTAAVIAEDVDINQQGLYSKSDLVDILTNRNFERKIYGKNNALLVQFYNSFCGHCRAFAPKFQTLAADLVRWKNVLKLAVIDCSVEENTDICRQFEIMAYPTLRYFHENYAKANGNVGEKIQLADTPDDLRIQLIRKLQSEQSRGRLQFAPSFDIASFASYAVALSSVPTNILYTFLVFENENSTIGTELALDISGYKDIKLKRVYDTSELADVAGLTAFPAIIAVKLNLEATNITPRVLPSRQNLLTAINAFLISKDYHFTEKQLIRENVVNEHQDSQTLKSNDAVYYSDLEKTLKTSLHTEITRYNMLSGEALQALIDYLDALLVSFPFRGNLKDYITGLRATIASKTSWSGSEIYDTVKRLEESYAPVYTSNLDYVACRGSLPKYRGYTCGLWALFHTMTVNAARKQELAGPKVLRAMYGYVKHFFGCTECSQHFQAMSERNRIFDVKENDKAVLWLWISHNEVNLRLAGDVTEDPEHPKIQFPSINKCPECRLARGAWNLPAVYEYLQGMYGVEHIQDVRKGRSAVPAPSPFSNLDIGMLSLLYILSFVILILVIKYFLTKRFYRKRHYKLGRGKV